MSGCTNLAPSLDGSVDGAADVVVVVAGDEASDRAEASVEADVADTGSSDTANDSSIDEFSTDAIDSGTTDSAVDSAPSDSGAPDSIAPDSGMDSGASDAGTDAACVQAPVAMQPTTQAVPDKQPVQWATPLTAFCGNNPCWDLPFTTSQTTLLVAYMPHTVNAPVQTWGVLSGCDVNAVTLASGTNTHVTAFVANAGTYSFALSRLVNNINTPNTYWVEGLPPVATNTSCGNEAVLPYNEPRVIDGQPRTYKFTLNFAASNVQLMVTAPDKAGDPPTASARTVCNNPATEFAKDQPMLWQNGAYPMALGNLQAGTYYVVFSNIAYATRFNLQVF